jgi:serine/threonine-protein kinase RsbT
VLALKSSDDIVRSRQKVREMAIALGFSLVEQTKLVTAASEIARNTVVHGGGGEMHLEPISNGSRQGLRLTFIDQGPGIADIAQAMCDGFSTGNSLGLGLGGTQRLTEDFTIESQLGLGTRVSFMRWR